MTKPTLFISDLHLEESHPEITKAFERFIEAEALNAKALYILGDFFESWVGDDDNTPFIQQIKSLLKKLTTAGVAVYFMRGNRDFLLGKRFAKETGLHLLPDPTVIELNGQRILLTHGDYLCTDDLSHQRFLKKADNPLYRFLFQCLPLSIRKKMANYVREKSKKRHAIRRHSAHYPKETDVNEATVKHWMQKHQVLIMIHGHTHRPKTHEYSLNGKIAKRIVLSDWDAQYYFEAFL